MKEIALAIDLGGTKCAGALIDRSGKILNKSSVKLEGRKGTEVSDLILKLADKLVSGSIPDKTGLRGIGVSVPGISYQKSGKVWAPNIPGWEDFPLGNILKNHFDVNSGTFIDSDRACCILGETWLGEGKGCKNAVFLAVGTGIGAGILMDGHILRGAQDIAGAIGWMALETEYLALYRKYGCFEYHASGDGLVREAHDRLEKYSPEHQTRMKKVEIDASQIFGMYKKNDPLARDVIKKAIRLWGKAVANLVSLLNPEIIIFGGGVFGPAAEYLDEIKKEATFWAQPISMQHVKLTTSKLKEDAALVGAGRLVFNDI